MYHMSSHKKGVSSCQIYKKNLMVFRPSPKNANVINNENFYICFIYYLRTLMHL